MKKHEPYKSEPTQETRTKLQIKAFFYYNNQINQKKLLK